MAYEARIQGVGFVLAMLARGETEVRKRLTVALRDTGREFTARFQKRHLRGNTGPSRVGRRTGNLAKAFNFRVQGKSLSDLSLIIGFGPPVVSAWPGGAERYAGSHLEGATIRPKRGKFLAIPVADGLTARGVPRFASLRDVPDVDFVPHLFKSGMGFLAIQDTGGGQGNLMALLLRRVTIPKRLYLHESFDAIGRPMLFRRMDKALDGAAKSLEKGRP